MTLNPILNTDGYKPSHWRQYPPGTDGLYEYISSRGGAYDKVLFFGLQAFLLEYMTKRVTVEDITEARSILTPYGAPFNEEGWEYIVREHGGKLPVRIRAVPEGTAVPMGVPIVTVESTDPKVFWLPSYLETALLRAVWYPTTVATTSWMVRSYIRMYLEKTSDDVEGQLPWKLHDFGARGVSSEESAALGGLGHLVSFQGTDTISAIVAARQPTRENLDRLWAVTARAVLEREGNSVGTCSGSYRNCGVPMHYTEPAQPEPMYACCVCDLAFTESEVGDRRFIPKHDPVLLPENDGSPYR